jgi:branched-chain amino acid transport system substrate-binding protein
MARMILPLLSLLLLMPAAAQAKIADHKIKIGVLQDFPAPYAGEAGNGGIVAAQLAAGDFAVHALRDDGEIIPGTASGATEKVLDQVRDWLDKEHVAAVLSPAGPLLDAEIARLVAQRHRTLLVAANDAGDSDRLCAPNVIVWGAGAMSRARAIGQAIAPRGIGGWFLLADQSPDGLAGQTALRAVVQAGGGRIAGEADNVVGGADLGKVMPQIAASNAQVVALAESDWDLMEILRSAMPAGLPHAATLVAPYAHIADIDDAGPAAANGLLVVAPYYWDTNDRTRDFARRWSDRMQGQHVTENAAAAYAATLSFLHAARAADDVDAGKVLAELRRAPINDSLFGTASIRSDGRVMYDLNVYRVKTPDAIQARWAYFSKIATIPAAQAFPPTACGNTPTN